MTLHQLRIFACVARHLNITQAATELHISQPALSHQLKLLEDELAVKFHSRMSHGVELTEQGRDFLEAIRFLLQQADSIKKRFRMNRSTENARFLKIGGSNSVSVDLLPKILTAFKRTHPEVEFVLETNNSSVIERRILNSELEIALVTNPSYSPLIAYETYEKLRLVAFAAPTSPMVGKTVTAKEFARGPLVVRKGRLILEELVRRGYRPNVAAKCEATEVVKGTVQRGMGVGILHSKSVEHDIESGLLKKINVPELKKQFERRSFIIYEKRKPLSGVAQDLLELLHERAASRAQRGPTRRRELDC